MAEKYIILPKGDDEPVTRGELRAATKMILDYTNQLTFYLTISITGAVAPTAITPDERRQAQDKLKKLATKLERALQLDGVSIDDD